MGTTIKKIAENNFFKNALNLKFTKTNVYKRRYGDENETLLFSYGNDGELSTIYRGEFSGISTVITLEKPELFDEFNVINNSEDDDLRLHEMFSEFDYNQNSEHNWENATAKLEGSAVALTIGRIKDKFYAHILLGQQNETFRIEMVEPIEWCFEN